MPCPPIAVYRRMKQFRTLKQILPHYAPVADGLALSTRCAAVIATPVGIAVCAKRQGDAVSAPGLDHCHPPIVSGHGVRGFCRQRRTWRNVVRPEAMRLKSRHSHVAELS